MSFNQLVLLGFLIGGILTVAIINMLRLRRIEKISEANNAMLKVIYNKE